MQDVVVWLCAVIKIPSCNALKSKLILRHSTSKFRRDVIKIEQATNVNMIKQYIYIRPYNISFAKQSYIYQAQISSFLKRHK